jgi:hypothetical protein
MPDSKTVLMTVTGTNGPPTLEEAARQIGVDVSKLNAAFGVIAIDPERNNYAVEVDTDAVPRGTSGSVRGPFSNPPIAPFGPIQDGTKKKPE